MQKSEAVQHPFFNKRTLSMEELERNFQTIKLEQRQKNNSRSSFSSTYSDAGSDNGKGNSGGDLGRKRADSENSTDISANSNNSKMQLPEVEKHQLIEEEKELILP